MGEYFTISQLQKMYEAILNKPLDKRNFRRKIKKLDILSATDLKEKNVVNKPARFYKFNEAIYNALIENGFDNFGF